MKIRYGIVAYTLRDKENPWIDVKHFCAYENPPSESDFLSLTDELNTDPEFGLVGRIGEDVFLMMATPEMIADMIDKLGTDEF